LPLAGPAQQFLHRIESQNDFVQFFPDGAAIDNPHNVFRCVEGLGSESVIGGLLCESHVVAPKEVLVKDINVFTAYFSGWLLVLCPPSMYPM
jgi:hypothetical protein